MYFLVPFIIFFIDILIPHFNYFIFFNKFKLLYNIQKKF
jgi:hypothetical protein